MTEIVEQAFLSVTFRKVNSDEEISASIFTPQWLPNEDLALSKWFVKYEIAIKGRDALLRHAYSENLLTSVLTAIEGIRRVVPSGEGDIWETPEGLPAWVVLPRPIPITWGYETYKECDAALDEVEGRINARIDSQRKKRGGPTDEK